MVPMLIPLVGDTKFAAGWTTFWGKVSGVSGGLLDDIAMIGMVMVVFAFGKWLWDRRRGNGGGGGGSGLIITIIVGAILASPTTIIPGVLTIADWLVAIFGSLLP